MQRTKPILGAIVGLGIGLAVGLLAVHAAGLAFHVEADENLQQARKILENLDRLTAVFGGEPAGLGAFKQFLDDAEREAKARVRRERLAASFLLAGYALLGLTSGAYVARPVSSPKCPVPPHGGVRPVAPAPPRLGGKR